MSKNCPFSPDDDVHWDEVTLLMIDAGPLPSLLYHFVDFPFLFSNDVLDLSYVCITVSGSSGQVACYQSEISRLVIFLTVTLLLVIFFASSCSFIHL